MTNIDRRSFGMAAAGAVFALHSAAFSASARSVSTMASKVADMRHAMKLFEIAFKGDEYGNSYQATVEHAVDAVEAVFTTPPASADEDDAVIEALEAYRQVAPSWFSLQTAHDLFTPARYRSYALDRLRDGLLSDPDEEFVKSGMPWFLKAMRQGQIGT
ncbi:hypothetical protein [Afipia clevelandensis]|uniref:Uncharacterized protein n=1 Tax=Afipia clevelandensis ATCC 49720 TaxID=883079 RepID=K8P1Q2_9BRAD|nr:hypothetical protein [Afipia clevelandensis]EKS35371.1 hypothetical protein HMPREF9696_02643 [Afipia clevelandensis ATCC 49720]